MGISVHIVSALTALILNQPLWESLPFYFVMPCVMGGGEVSRGGVNALLNITCVSLKMNALLLALVLIIAFTKRTLVYRITLFSMACFMAR